MGVGVTQKLFDGGVVGVQKDMKAIEGEIKNLETEAGLYQLNELVNQYFFGILSMKQSARILMLKEEVLVEREKSIKSGVEQGVVLESELSRIRAEIAYAKQQLIEVELGINKLKESLKVLAGFNAVTFELVVPDSILINDTIKRVELNLFSANRNYLESAGKLQNKRYLPHFDAFGKAGYSYPGLNMFENQSDMYYIVGVKLAWQLVDWNQSKKEKQLLMLQKSSVDISQVDFLRGVELKVRVEEQEIEKIQELILHDKEIIAYKKQVSLSSASSLDNGTITTADYIADLNAELNARYEFERHKIRLMEARAKLAVIKGIEIN
jgi:outer membrane protein TolC